MKRLPYAIEQAAAFVAVCCVFGAMAGALWATAKGWLR